MMRTTRHLPLAAFFVALAMALLFLSDAVEIRAQGASSESAANADGDRRGERRRRWSRDNDERQSRPTTETKPATPVPSTTSTFGTSAAGGNTDRSADIRKYATDLVRTNDRNGNMMLEESEQANLGTSSRGADANGDKVITLDELVAHLTPKTAAATPATTGFGTVSNSRPASTSEATKRDDDHDDDTKPSTITKKHADKTYRFRSQKDRQPSWRFSGKDANGDGQVSMSEYSGSWTDRTANEFRRYDRDNDGMITPAEVR